MQKIKTSFIKCLNSFKYAKNGMIHAFISENNFNYHFLGALLVVVLGGIMNLDYLEWIVIVFCIGLVFISELFNTAIEKLTDLISPDFNKKAGLIKDISAAGVLMASIIATISGIILFVSKFLE